MIIEYKEKVNLRVNDFDCNDNILVSSILDLFQDVAGNYRRRGCIDFDDQPYSGRDSQKNGLCGNYGRR